ncbi:MAG: B12-binding domain-containing radical SAM protein [Oscillospiraceae bacterium]|nr:B12-binding domain-containing radical SAM protein [Oscillospiraceae bacterium]
MKILLCAVNAKYIHTNIAVRLIGGYCRERISSDISIAEYTINNHTDDIVQDLYAKHPDVIAFSCYIWNIRMIYEICTVLKKILPEILIVLGGPEVTYNPHQILTNLPECDFIITGEGEESSRQLYSCLENGSDLSEISGITYRDNSGKIISNPQNAPIDMGVLPFPYDNFEEIQHRICYYEASRGCPFRCQYCLSSVEKGVRFAPIEKVKKELSIFLEHRVKQVKFVDRTFNANNSFAIEIVNFLIDNDNKITNFHFEVAAETLSDELLSLLKSARKGLFQLEIGVQSTNSSTLKTICRNGIIEKVGYVTEELKKAGNIHVHLDLIAGLPHEDIKSFVNSFNDVHSLLPHQLQLGFLKVLHGSGMEKMCNEYKISYSPFPPYEVLKTHCLSYDDILFLKQIEEMVETYYNSNRFVHSLNYLSKHCSDYFGMYAVLSSRRSQMFTENLTHNKNDTYRFLIDAADSFENINKNKFMRIVKFDYLLHEKPKGTPDWVSTMLNPLNKDDIYDITIRKNAFQEKFSSLSGVSRKELLNATHVEKMYFNPVTFEDNECIIYFNYTERDTFGNAEYWIENVRREK